MAVYIVFLLLVLVCIVLDLVVINKSTHELSKARKRATNATIIWVTIGLLYSLFIYFGYENHWYGLGNEVGLPTGGRTAAIHYVTGYLVELSLSVDNVFVMILIFQYFKIPYYNQHKALIYGILGAIVFRGILIYLGHILLQEFSWFNYVFGAILIYSAYKLWKENPSEEDMADNKMITFLRKILPVIKDPTNPHFITRVRGILVVTPLFLALIMIELSDIMFAFDSIPAIFGITRDPFIVFSSNIFAILGLRSLFLVLTSFLDRFSNIKYSLVFILFFIGIKISLEHVVEIPTAVSFPIIILALAVGVLTSAKKAS